MTVRTVLVVVAALTGCSFSAKLDGGRLGNSGSSTPFPGRGNDSTPRVTANAAHAAPSPAPSDAEPLIVPDLAGKSIEQAAAALRAAGFQFDRLEPSDFVCDYRDDSQMVEQGSVCDQDPTAGARRLPRLIAVRVTIEHDTYDHGAVGKASEWRRMPDVVDKPIDVARTLLSGAHLPIGDHFELVESDADGCSAGEVCATEPKAAGRKVVSRKGRIHVGRVRPTETPPTAPTQATTGDTFF